MNLVQNDACLSRNELGLRHQGGKVKKDGVDILVSEKSRDLIGLQSKVDVYDRVVVLPRKLLDNEGFATLTNSFDDKGVVARLIFPLQEGIFSV